MTIFFPDEQRTNPKVDLISGISRLRDANYLPLPSKIGRMQNRNFALTLIAKFFSRIITKTSHHRNP